LIQAAPLVLLCGCSSWESRARLAVLTSENSFRFYTARHEETCAKPPQPPPCSASFAALTRWSRDLDQAHAAVKLGGKLPLQLGALKADQKTARRAVEALR
jgi:hypothetical protein